MRRLLSLVIVSAALLGAGGGADARVDVTDTLLLSQPATSGQHVAFIYAGDLWSARLDGSDVRRLTTDDGQESSPAFSPDGARIAFSAQYRGEHRRVRGARAGGRAGAAHVAPRRRPRAGVHGRRQERAVHVGARGLHDPVHAALHRSRGRRGRGSAADSQRGARDLLAGRPAHRLQPAWPGVPAVEALPRRPYVAHLAVRDTQSRRRARPAAARPRERRGSDVGGRHGVLSIGSERRVQPVQLRHEVEGDPAADPARRLSRPQRVGRRRADCLRAGGPAARARSRRRDDAGADDRRSRGPAGNAAAIRQRHALHPQRRALAVRRAGGVRVPRRDRHRAGRERGHAQSDGHPRGARAQPRVVAGRQADRRTSPTPPASTRCTSPARTAKASRASSRSRGPASTGRRSGLPTARRSRTSTTRRASTGST